jgi:hypothetical protein
MILLSATFADLICCICSCPLGISLHLSSRRTSFSLPIASIFLHLNLIWCFARQCCRSPFGYLPTILSLQR